MRIDVRESGEGSNRKAPLQAGRIEVDPEARPNLVRILPKGTSQGAERPADDGSAGDPAGERGAHCFLNWEGAVDDSGHLRKCLLCGCDHMYRSKALPQVTPFIVALAFAGAVFGLLGFASNPFVLPVLVVLLAVDIATLALAKERLVCYRCRSVYSRLRIARYHRRWSRGEEEKVRTSAGAAVAGQAGP